jgi:hypothetical protein
VEGGLERVGIAAMRRGETLTLDEFARLSDALPSQVSRDPVADGQPDPGADTEW